MAMAEATPHFGCVLCSAIKFTNFRGPRPSLFSLSNTKKLPLPSSSVAPLPPYLGRIEVRQSKG